MIRKSGVHRVPIFYSEAFKREIVREVESGDSSYGAISRKYGIGGNLTIRRWVGKYGNGLRGKVIRVEKPEEINEMALLKRRIKRLEPALADSNIDLALERAYTQMACERAGIKDVEEFKKKVDGARHTKP
jgi:transposase-like protein